MSQPSKNQIKPIVCTLDRGGKEGTGGSYSSTFPATACPGGRHCAHPALLNLKARSAGLFYLVKTGRRDAYRWLRVIAERCGQLAQPVVAPYELTRTCRAGKSRKDTGRFLGCAIDTNTRGAL